MSSQRPRGQSKILVSCGFGQSTSTTNLARTICGLLFVLRFVTFSMRSNLRTDIRSKVVDLLDQRNIQHSSVDLVRFSWVEENEDVEEDEDDEDMEDDEDNVRVKPLFKKDRIPFVTRDANAAYRVFYIVDHKLCNTIALVLLRLTMEDRLYRRVFSDS